jgi:serine/threonine-protein kinase
MATQQIDCDTILTRLRESGLLSESDLLRANELALEMPRGKALARALVEHGLLTHFQAGMIYRGRTEGFTLGQYRILDQLGRGGMGRVFKAEHQTMNRVVALKVLSPELMRTERARRLFQREVRAAARLVHPNIVTAFDANQAGDRHYLVMEFVDGPNLHDLVKERGPLPVGQACEFIRQAAIGLQYAHEMGMVHRDIKPGNLLVQISGKNCVVKVLDFGLARLYDPATSQPAKPDSVHSAEHQVMGTPDFLSPEQARNLNSANIRSDLYSLGCTMYFLLTAQVPFPGGTMLEKLVRHASEPEVPVHQLRADLPVEVSAIIARMMAKQPQDRFATPLEVAQALAPYSELGPNAFRTMDSAQGTSPPPVGESPWANLFDDEAMSPSTVPADITVMPDDRKENPSGPAPTAPDQPGKPWPAWVRPMIIVGAAAAGFLIGASCLWLWLK